MNVCDINDRAIDKKLSDIYDYIVSNRENMTIKELEDVNAVLNAIDEGITDNLGKLHAKASAHIATRNSMKNLRSSGIASGKLTKDSKGSDFIRQKAMGIMKLFGSTSAIFRGLFRRGKFDSGIFLADSGVDAFQSAVVRVESKVAEKEKQLQKLIGRVSSLRTISGQQKLGVIAHLIKINPDNQNNWEERVQQVIDAAEKYRKRGNKHDLAVAVALERVIDEFDLENIKTREDFMEKVFNNEKYSEEKKVLDFMIEMFNEIMPEHQRVASMYFNTMLTPQQNYTPDTILKGNQYKYEQQRGKTIADFLDNSLSEPGSKISTESKSKAINEVQKVVELKEGDVHDFRILSNAMLKYKDALLDIETTESLHHMNQYLSDGEAMETIFQNQEEVRFARSAIDNLVRNVKGRAYEDSDSLDFVRSASSLVAEFSTIRGLGSLSQPIKQVVPAFLKTMIMVRNPKLIASMMRPFSGAEVGFLNAYSTTNYRGVTSQMGSLDRDVRKEVGYAGQVANIGVRGVANLGRMYLDKLLVNPDKAVANRAFLAYYKQYIKDTEGRDVDFSSEKPNTRAIGFANSQVDLMMNSSLSQSMGSLFSSQNVGLQLLRRLVMPFASMQQANRNSIMSASHALVSSGYKIDKNSVEIVGGSFKFNALATLGANIGEIALFNGIRYFLGKSIAVAAAPKLAELIKLAYPYDEDEFEDRLMKSSLTAIASDVVPLPGLDFVTLSLINSLVDEDTALMEHLYKIDVFNERQADLFYDPEIGYGLYGVAIDDGAFMAELIKSLYTETKGFRSDIPLSEAEKNQVESILLLSAISYLTPSDMNSTIKRLFKEIKYYDPGKPSDLGAAFDYSDASESSISESEIKD